MSSKVSVIRGKFNSNLKEPRMADIGIVTTTTNMTVVRMIGISGDVRAGYASIYSGRPLF